ncbi:hypothetical protein CKA32_006563 [Geitlerinema sp. FC II]|nr:hypothetical protein CKA32_006563 [Geitlerinema sp. FC II]
MSFEPESIFRGFHNEYLDKNKISRFKQKFKQLNFNMPEDLNKIVEENVGKEPLCDYPWLELADRLINWASYQKDEACLAFSFDLLTSLSYLDKIPFLQKYLRCYPEGSLPQSCNYHLGFINLCAPLLIANDI